MESHNENQHCWEHSHQGCCAILGPQKSDSEYCEETATFVSLIQHALSINADQIRAIHKTQSSQALTGCSVNTIWMRVALNLKHPVEHLNTSSEMKYCTIPPTLKQVRTAHNIMLSFILYQIWHFWSILTDHNSESLLTFIFNIFSKTSMFLITLQCPISRHSDRTVAHSMSECIAW